MTNTNLTLHTDKYQINMMYGQWKLKRHNNIRVFEAYFRKLPFSNGFAVAAGLERIVNYINQLSFEKEHIDYLRTQPENYEEAFLEELSTFKFTGTIHAITEGTIVFPNEPMYRIEGRLFEVQLIETAILNFMNYQTLIATKAARIKQVDREASLLELGTRRAQEADAAIWGARASYIAGFDGTSNMEAGRLFGIPSFGTQAHAWIMDFDSELEAFRAYASVFPTNTTLLVDTYDTLKSGIPNAIIVAKELAEKGFSLRGIRLDSGDLARLSSEARSMLDSAGFPNVRIIASNDLDENVIFNLKMQNSKVDSWGIGTQLITAADNPSLGGVYKLVAKKDSDGSYIPVIKMSENIEKITNPGFKELYRVINRSTNKVEADYLALGDEQIDTSSPLHLFDPVNTWKDKWVTNYRLEKLLTPIFIDGKQVYSLPSLEEIRDYHKSQLSLFWDEHLRKLNPQHYYVDLSQNLWDMKMNLIHNQK